jgi:hypothetical protein
VPILEIEIVLRPRESLAADLASRIADAAGAVFASGPRGTWVRLRTLVPERYAESGAADPDVFPVFVSVLKADYSTQPPEDEPGRLAVVIAELCDRPTENIHILYQPDARRRIAFGGTLLE